MPQQPSKQPDFIPAPQPDFIPAEQPSTDIATPDERNALQRAFDSATTVTPEQEKGHSYPVNALQHVGAHVIGMASPLVHPLRAIEHAGEALTNPSDTFSSVVQGVKDDPWGALGDVLGGAVLGGGIQEAPGGMKPFAAKGPGTLGRVMDAIPTRAKAGAIFEDLNQKLANQPVSLTNTSPRLQRVAEIGERGGTLPSSVNKFLQRSQSPIEMTYPEARDYQSNLSSLSREDQGNMTGPMKGGVKQLNKAYFEDMKNAAGPYGEDYEKAMTMNRRANQIRTAAKNVGKIAIPAAIGTTAYKLTKAMER